MDFQYGQGERAGQEWEEQLEDAIAKANAAGVKVLGIVESIKEGYELEDGDLAVVRQFINETHRRFVDVGERVTTFAEYTDFTARNFALLDEHPQDLDMEAINGKIGEIIAPIMAVADVVNYVDEEALTALLDAKMGRTLCIVNGMKDMLMHARATKICSTCGINDLATFSSNFEVFKFLNGRLDPEAETDVVRFALHTLQLLHTHQYKRHGDWCYKQHSIAKVWGTDENGKPALVDYDEEQHSIGERIIIQTRSWRQVCTITEFVHREACNKLVHPEMWKIQLNRPGVVATVEKDLIHGVHHEFKELKINQHMFAFSNGIYHTEKQQFYPWRVPGGPSATEALKADGVAETEACINYFDLECEVAAYTQSVGMEMSYMNIPTPTLDRIMEHQMRQLLPAGKKDVAELTEAEAAHYHATCREVMSWIYCHLGRLMFPLHKHDYWQIVLYIMGVAGTGKSTLAELFFDIFPAELIAILSSNAEKQFGLQTLYDKPLWMCMEVKENFSLNLADLQSIISGERVQVSVKNEAARMVHWKSPGMMCGNLVPPWADKSGALFRRFVLVHFNEGLKDAQKDGSLKRQLREEMGRIIPKLSLAYMHRTRQLGEQRDLWSAMPPTFHKWRTVFQKGVDPVMAFVEDGGKVRVDPMGYCLEDKFLEDIKEFIGKTKCDKTKREFTWSEDTYQHFFRNNDINRVVTTKPWEGSFKKATYLIGLVHTDMEHYLDAPDPEAVAMEE